MRFNAMACAALAGGLILGGAVGANAAEGDNSGQWRAVAPPTTPTCPAVRWHVIGDTTPTHYKGVVWFADFSGASILTATMRSNGSFTGTVKSVAGKGPSGTVTGSRTAQGLNAHLAGPGCSNVTVGIPYYPNDQGSRG